ncbi:MAG: beta-propeller fold lactonase family protein, partial [Thiomonas sp.]
RLCLPHRCHHGRAHTGRRQSVCRRKHPYSVTVTPAGTFAYVANAGSNNVSAYSINATTGALTPVAGSPFAAGNLPLSVVVAQP